MDPEPAARTRTSSKIPWYAPANTAILSRPLTVRARRIAAVTASDPVLQNPTLSICTIAETRAATSPASADCGPISIPASSCAWSASRMKPGLCPNMMAPKPFVRSTYSFPSTSQSLDPAERTVTIG